MEMCSEKNIESNDELLLRLIQSGDRYAFTEIYNRYHKLLYILAYRYLQDKELSEDAVQHVFVKIWELREDLHISLNFKNYICMMLKNHVWNVIRNENNMIQHNFEIYQEASEFVDDMTEKMERQELHSIVYKLVNELPEQKKMICRMKIQGDFSNVEIADKLMISVNTVKTHYMQAIKLLRVGMNKIVVMGIILLMA